MAVELDVVVAVFLSVHKQRRVQRTAQVNDKKL
jgi:hypothetical protein